MDGQRFDELTRRLGAGLSRRQLVRALLGGAGALTATAVFREQASAQGGIGDPCEEDIDCAIDLTCGSGESGCRCEPNENTITCPAETPHATESKKDSGTCCDGNGNCCSNNCVDNVCSATPLCSEETGACDEANPCCAGLICFSGTCEVPCTTDDDCVPSDLGPCCNAACDTTNGICFKFGDDDLCDAGSCQFCDSSSGTCVYSCNEGEEICCNDQCVVGVCCTAADCTETETCFEAECYDGQCVYTPNDDLCADMGDCSNKECTIAGSCSYTQAPDNCSGCQFCSDEFVCTDGCPNGQVCCENACVPGDCCDVGDCIAPDGCVEVGCAGNLCIYMTNDNLCPESCQTCQQDGSCTSDCASDEVCCDNACVEGDCCDTEDCQLSNCARVACTNNLCGAVSLCPPQAPNEVFCCAHEGQPELDYCYIPADGECCFDEECGQVIISEGNCLIPGCFSGVCGFVRDNAQCANDECCCENGSCSRDCCEDCREFGESCALIINGTFLATESDQLDCCDGLVCCEVGNDHVCADCCGDWDCPKGSICCAGVCREIECCIDDILTGGNPNDRCPDSCTCFEGLCVDKDQKRCLGCHDHQDCGEGTCCCQDGTCSHHCCDTRECKHDHDCDKDECCCRNGSCSHHCCEDPGCKGDHDCPKDTCCCQNGTCSSHCCDKPDDDTPEIDVLPNTGTGPGEDAASWVAGAALAAGAAALLGSKVRKDMTPAGEPDA